MDPRERAREFGRRLRQVRENRGESLREVERRSGLKNGYLSQLENGKIVHPSPTVLEKVAVGYALSFEDLLKWAGYMPESSQEVTPNQALALSTVSALGDPSDEELQALTAIVNLLQRNRTATFASSSDLPLDDAAVETIRGYTYALLREADAVGRRPTPLEDVQAAARLVLTGEVTLDRADRARLRERFGRWVELAWKRLQGTFDSRTSEIWVKPELHPMKRRFVISHEIGHAILPAHKRLFAYVDDYTTLPPLGREAVEREANRAAVEILFQCGAFTEEFDATPPSVRNIANLSTEFGGSIVSAARYAAETSQRAVAVSIAHWNERGLGPTHVYASSTFREAVGWERANAPWPELRGALRTATAEETETWVIGDRRNEPRVVTVQKIDTGFAAIVLVTLEPRRHRFRKVTPLPAGAVLLSQR